MAENLHREQESEVSYLRQRISELVTEAGALTPERRLFQTLMNFLPDHVYFKDAQSRFILINRAKALAHGLSDPSEAVGKTDFDFFPEDQAGQAFGDERRILETGEPLLRQVERRDFGDHCGPWWSATKVPLLDSSGAVVGIFGLSRDITELHEAQEALRESEERYRLIFEGSSDAITFRGAGGKRLLFNTRTLEMFGYKAEEIMGLDAFALVHPEDRGWMMENNRRRMAGEDFQNRYEFRGVHRDGHTIHIEGRFEAVRKDDEIIGVCTILHDITELKRVEEERQRLEEQVRHAQKLESLGILAGGIAHDFNNLLVVIMGNADLASMELPPGSEAAGPVEEIRRACARASELTRQMLAYSGRGRFVIKPLDLTALVQEMAGLLEVSISKKAQLRYEFDYALPPIEADAGQISQVVMNLITNASEALGDEPGDITLRTGLMEATPGYLADTYIDENLPGGRYVFLEVSDTGCGMTPETKARLFDPFFTTKFTGRGLGLAAVLGIVRSHRGAINVISEPGAGATIRALFPPSPIPLPDDNSSRAHPSPAWRGSGIVLLVDDEETVRKVTRLLLERLGFTVLEAANGEEALGVFAQDPQALRAALLDLSLPGMSAEAVCAGIREARPSMPIFLMSGYTERDVLEGIDVSQMAGFLQKPFQANALVEVLKKGLR